MQRGTHEQSPFDSTFDDDPIPQSLFTHPVGQLRHLLPPQQIRGFNGMMYTPTPQFDFDESVAPVFAPSTTPSVTMLGGDLTSALDGTEHLMQRSTAHSPFASREDGDSEHSIDMDLSNQRRHGKVQHTDDCLFTLPDRLQYSLPMPPTSHPGLPFSPLDDSSGFQTDSLPSPVSFLSELGEESLQNSDLPPPRPRPPPQPPSRSGLPVRVQRVLDDRTLSNGLRFIGISPPCAQRQFTLMESARRGFKVVVIENFRGLESSVIDPNGPVVNLNLMKLHRLVMWIPMPLYQASIYRSSERVVEDMLQTVRTIMQPTFSNELQIFVRMSVFFVGFLRKKGREYCFARRRTTLRMQPESSHEWYCPSSLLSGRILLPNPLNQARVPCLEFFAQDDPRSQMGDSDLSNDSNRVDLRRFELFFSLKHFKPSEQMDESGSRLIRNQNSVFRCDICVRVIYQREILDRLDTSFTFLSNKFKKKAGVVLRECPSLQLLNRRAVSSSKWWAES